jgi:hypothetical protein
MKSDFKKIFRKRILPTLLAVLALSVCSITAFAVGEDDPQVPYSQPEPVVTEYVPDETEPQYTEPVYTEPVYTEAPTTEYVAPETEEPTTEYVQPETTEAPVQEETQYQNQYVETQATDSTEFQAPTIAKTVSEKKYSTSYTAGIVSWICVGLGVVVIAVVMISTKVGARKRIR